MSKGVQIALGAALIAVLAGWYASTSLDGGSYRYFQTLEEMRSAQLVGEPVRVHGFVAPGSIERDVQGRSIRFAVQNDPPHRAGIAPDPLPVVFASLEVSDMFKDGAEVVVEGTLAPASATGPVFHATNVLAKCPSKFQAKAGAAES